MPYDGSDRRRHTGECLEQKRFEKIELTTDGTIKELAKLNTTLTRIDENLKGKVEKYDTHCAEGDKWRTYITTLLVVACISGGAATVGFGIWVGRLQADMDRLMDLHPYGVAVEKITGG